MKAFAIMGSDDFQIIDMEIPTPADYEVLVQNEGCLFCNTTDRMIVEKLFQTPAYPVLLGHECFGKVVKIGPKVRNFSLGDRVICANAIPTGYNGTYYSTWGGFAEYGIAGDYEALVEDGCATEGAYAYRQRYSANYKIASDLSPRLAGLVFPLAETASCVMQVPEIAGKEVAVFGTGTAGYTLAIFAKQMGAAHVTVFGRTDHRIQTAVALGADEGKQSALAYTENKKYDVVFEVTGNARVFEKGLPFLKENGILAVYGVSTQPYQIDFGNTPDNYAFRRVTPRVKDALALAEDMLRNGKIPTEKLLTHEWQFSEVADALRTVKAGDVIKGLVWF